MSAQSEIDGRGLRGYLNTMSALVGFEVTIRRFEPAIEWMEDEYCPKKMVKKLNGGEMNYFFLLTCVRMGQPGRPRKGWDPAGAGRASVSDVGAGRLVKRRRFHAGSCPPRRRRRWPAGGRTTPVDGRRRRCRRRYRRRRPPASLWWRAGTTDRRSPLWPRWSPWSSMRQLHNGSITARLDCIGTRAIATAMTTRTTEWRKAGPGKCKFVVINSVDAISGISQDWPEFRPISQIFRYAFPQYFLFTPKDFPWFPRSMIMSQIFSQFKELIATLQQQPTQTSGSKSCS